MDFCPDMPAGRGNKVGPKGAFTKPQPSANYYSFGVEHVHEQTNRRSQRFSGSLDDSQRIDVSCDSRGQHFLPRYRIARARFVIEFEQARP